MKAFSVLALLSLLAIAEVTPVTIEGTVVKVVPKKKEIYVKSDADSKKYEYYFKSDTVLTVNGAAAEFSALKEGQKVKVVAERVGKRLDPKTVEVTQ